MSFLGSSLRRQIYIIFDADDRHKVQLDKKRAQILHLVFHPYQFRFTIVVIQLTPDT